MPGDWAEGIRAKIDEQRQAIAEEQNKVNIKKKLPEVKPEDVKIRFDEKWIHKLM